jgi:Na+/alanine symporter
MSKVRGVSRNRDLAVVFGVALAALFSLASMEGFFTQRIPSEFHFPLWALMVLVLIFIPLLRGVTRWTALGAGIVGIILIIWISFELIVFIPSTEAFGPILGLVFAILFSLFSFRAYTEKPST